MRLTGILNVFRDGYCKDYLSCDIKTQINGEEKSLYWSKVPKCFDIVEGHKNVVEIEFDINDDFKYPKNVKIIGEPISPF